ncbi:MAG: hypothetical protein K2I89_08980 [Muribaculaceae bacterium]|nr:hypothetical protein [Muribaculaceae bacterium]
MSRLYAFCLIICGIATGVTSCNSSSETLDYEVPSSALVKSFTLSEDEKVLDNLDKVFFSIDLANGKIFNADSMPYGTKVNKLVPIITTGGASAVELVVPRPGKSDTTYNYLTNSTDSIDFSNGAVTLKIQSIDQTVTMSYAINVNVHKIKSDSLAWGDMAYETLPTTLDNVTEQHSLKFKDKVYCLTTDGNNFCMMSSSSLMDKVWSNENITFGFAADVTTFRASSDAMYILDADGNMYKSDDNGATWSSTGQKYDYLIGGYDDMMIGTVREDGGWKITYSDGTAIDAPAEFPVTGTSVPVEYGFPMSASRQMTIVGGRMASGELSADAWGFDGNSWARLTNRGLPEGLEGVTVTPYYTFEENQYWVATQESIFVLIGGRNAAGKCNSTTYISYNYGMTWKKAPALMQLPSDVPVLYGAQTILFSSMLGSRASTAITSWECPYIYIFGGKTSNGQFNKNVWRGVINRLMFKPLQ